MNILTNKNGSALLIVLTVGLVIALIGMTTLLSTSFSTQKISQRRLAVSAFNIAEAGKEHALANVRGENVQLVPNTLTRMFSNQPFEKGFYTVDYLANALLDSLWIKSVGKVREFMDTIQIICTQRRTSISLNPVPLAAVTTRSDVTTRGRITIDGRDWDPEDPSNPIGNGIPGINYGGIIDQGGNSQIGGMGSAPRRNAGIPIVNPISNAPRTPEEALGLEPGELDMMKSNTFPTIPFHDTLIYYTGGNFQAVNLQGSSGVLILHNDTWSAQIKNLHGNFSGIIITDQLVHVNANAMVYGAIFTLSTIPGGNAFGNGNANIRYSAQVIDYVTLNVRIELENSLDVVSWKHE